MRPTDEQLNLLMAQTLGYRSAGRTGMFAILVLRPGTDQPIAPPDFCNDRNTLQEIKQAIEAVRVHKLYSHHLRELCENSLQSDYDESRTFAVSFAPPRLVVIAALRALGQWPADWQI